MSERRRILLIEDEPDIVRGLSDALEFEGFEIIATVDGKAGVRAMRDKGADFLLRIATRVKDAAEAVETNLEEILRYRKGEFVGGGRFVCTKCAEALVLEESGPIPACKCGHEEWKRKA